MPRSNISAIRVAGRVCLDVGASTGGFTDCLLQRGAARVHAVDVGTGQLDWKIRSDPRVVVHEKLNARYLRREDLGEPVDLAVCDVSFISVTLILPAVGAVVTTGGRNGYTCQAPVRGGQGTGGQGWNRARTGVAASRLPPGGAMRRGSWDSRRASWRAPFWARKGTGSSCCMPTIKTVGIISKPGCAGCRREVVPKLLAWLEARGIAGALRRTHGATTPGAPTACRATRCRKAATW